MNNEIWPTYLIFNLGCPSAENRSESWIACIFLVLNLVKLAGTAPLCQMVKMINWSFSAMNHKLIRFKLLLSEFLSELNRLENWYLEAI